MGDVKQDLRYALRRIWKRPGMSAAAILCLALGIGATTLIYSLVDGVLLSPLPYEDPGRIYLVQLSFPAEGLDRTPLSGKEFEDFQAEKRIFSEVGGIVGWNFNVNSLDPPERLRGGRLSASAFRILGVAPARGRIFNDDETARGERLAVLSHRLWQRAFGADPAILGKRITLSQVPHEVIGIMPQDFQPIPADTDVWIPLVPNPRIPRHLRGVQVLARLRQDVDPTEANAFLDNLELRFVQDHADVYPATGWGIELDPLREALLDESVETRLLAFSGAVVLVLLIACANVANLLLAQATGREKEFAMRAAFGAGRPRLVRQLLTESAILALAGAAAGLLLAIYGLRLVLALELGDIPRLDEVAIDGRALLFTLVAALLTSGLFGLVPALRLSGTSFSAALKEGGRTAAASGRHPLRSSLVVLELALACIALIGTGLMLRSFDHLQRIDPGFDTADRTTMRIFLPPPAYAAGEARVGLYDRLRLRLEELPRIEGAALTSVLPLTGFRNTGQALIDGQDPTDSWPPVSWTMISPGFFELLEIPLLEGRDFADADRPDSHLVTIVDQHLARRLWPGQSPIGRRLKLNGGFDDAWREVVGVVGRIRQLDLTDDTEQLYLPFTQYPGRFLHPVLSTGGDPSQAAVMVRDAMGGIDRDLPVTDVTTLDALASQSLAGPRFNLTLFALFGAAAFLLAIIGTYGVIAYSAAQREVEIGVRRAFGARRRDVLRVILGRGMTLAVAGVLLGLAGAWGLSVLGARYFSSLVHGVPLTDATSFAAVAVALLATALLANLLPAYRAARIDPMRALRGE